jgi:UDP-N-acetylglucosamine--N-acetylmuramyl-(pentapeptide) pyrophosphoryl-undecaprenol N-acetylglucosamine transferase
MKKQPKKIVIAAGGTGGHLFPAQALAQYLQEKGESHSVLFLAAGLSSSPFFKRECFAYQEVSSHPLTRKNPLKALYLIGKGCMQSWRFMHQHRPDFVVSFGSYHSFPVCLIAWFKDIPLVLFESNVNPGKVNKFFSRIALFSAVQFASAAKKLRGKSFEVNMPVYHQASATKEEAYHYFSLEPSLQTILVFGGSQGAHFINGAVLKALQLFPSKEKVQVLHMVGKMESIEQMQAIYQELGIKSCVKAFEDRMHLAWTLADLAICRSGAATFAELVSFKVPSILIPYPHAAENHQQKNAELLQRHGAAFCLLEKDALPNELSALISRGLEKSFSEEMKKALEQFEKKQATRTLGELIDIELMEKSFGS